jgi:hypothetical protein
MQAGACLYYNAFMEIMKFLKLLKSKKRFVVYMSFIGIIMGYAFFLILPSRFVSEGSLFVYPVSSSNQDSEVSNELNYARNIIGLVETPEFKNYLKNKESLDISYIPLVGISYGVKIREVTPNLIFLSVVSDSSSESIRKYNLYYDSLQMFKERLKAGNSSFEIRKLEENIVSYEISKNLFAYLSVGLVFGFFSSTVYLYIRSEKNA